MHARNMDVKGNVGEVSDGNEKHIRNWKKDDPCYKMAKYSAELFSNVLWKVELASDENGYWAEVSKPSFEGVAWFLLTTYSKMQKERDEFKRNCKKEPEPKDLEIFLRIRIAKN